MELGWVWFSLAALVLAGLIVLVVLVYKRSHGSGGKKSCNRRRCCDTGATGLAGAAGTATNTGATGPGGSGPTGATGLAGTAVLGFAEFSRSGAQPGSLAAGQPFTFTDTNVGPTAGITKADAQVTNLAGGAAGTVITLANVGVYEINWICVPAADVGTQLALGPNQLGLVVLPYTMAGRTVGATQIVGSALITTTTPSSALCVIAATGNSAALQSATAGTTNTASTSVTIKQIA